MPPEEEISPIEYLKLQYRRFVEHSNSDKDPEIYAALAYIPFIGWFFTYFLRPKQSLCVFHAFQSLKITLVSAVVFTVLWFITHFPPISFILRIFFIQPVVTDFLFFLCWVFILGSSIFGAFKAYKEKAEIYLPYFDILEKKLEELDGKSEKS